MGAVARTRVICAVKLLSLDLYVVCQIYAACNDVVSRSLSEW